MKYCKLILISSENNNKFYEMTEENGQIKVNYGRIDSTSVTITKPLSQWDSIVREKQRKGYKNITDLVSIKEEIKPVIEEKTKEIEDVYVREFVTLLENYTKGLINSTYSVTPKNVTQQQIDQAQKLINELNNFKNFTEAQTNSLLIQLYTTIPRKMKDVKQHLLPILNLEKTLQKEQDQLDAMESMIDKNVVVAKSKKVKQSNTILDKMGVRMTLSDVTPEIKYIVDQFTSYQKVHKIFKVEKESEDLKLNSWIKDKKNKNTKFLIHGTRVTSVLPILSDKLRIHPIGNFQYSGKAFGDAIYFALQASKSLGYTGYTNDKILFVYEVHYGSPNIHSGWNRGTSFPLTFDELQKRGYDCTHAEKGNGLINDEIMIYHEDQCAPRYILWIK